ncbi:hypothetical protein LINPERPRIM_LOCUS17419 [Linum perenne]
MVKVLMFGETRGCVTMIICTWRLQLVAALKSSESLTFFFLIHASGIHQLSLIFSPLETRRRSSSLYPPLMASRINEFGT